MYIYIYIKIREMLFRSRARRFFRLNTGHADRRSTAVVEIRIARITFKVCLLLAKYNYQILLNLSDKNTHAQHRQRSSHERIRIARPRDYAHVQSMLAVLRHFVSVHAHTIIYIYVRISYMYTYTPYIVNNKAAATAF